MTQLWIDDLRLPPEGWTWAKTSAEAITILETSLGDITAISFDHDLGGDDTTRPVALWLAERGAFPEEVYIHSANIVGKQWLLSLINRYGSGAKVVTYRA